MSTGASALPIVRPLLRSVTPESAFEILRQLPGCIWFDSSTGDVGPSGRYSFITADPVRWLSASVGDPDPWPELRRWCVALPPECDPSLPPFQGGIAGLIGYEACAWLEPVGVAAEDDLPTEAVAVGLYDWTIVFDHGQQTQWLISQGLGARKRSGRLDKAARRASQVESWLETHKVPPEKRRCYQGDDLATRKLGRGNFSFPTSFEGVESNFSGQGFRAAVKEIVDRISQGDSFQVNLAQRLLRAADASSTELYCRLRQCNPAPFAAYFDAGEFQVLSSSPEGFLKVRDRRVETRPIKGTAPRTGDTSRDAELAKQLVASEKDRAENVMIVDLMRNDLSRVCDDDSVQVSQLCSVERYQHVQHLVSVIEGQLRDDATVVDLLRACFPGGSVTGAPKVEAMRTIAQLEPHRRGPYCGSLGYISCGGAADFNILIRTITASAGYWQIPVGGGITARSNPAAEEAETWTKARGMLEAVMRT